MFFVEAELLNCVNCNPVPPWNLEPSSQGALNSRLNSAASGLQLDLGDLRQTVYQQTSSPCGLFCRAEDKVKLSDDVIEEAFT